MIGHRRYRWTRVALFVASASLIALLAFWSLDYIRTYPERELKSAVVELVSGKLAAAHHGFDDYLRQRPDSIAVRYDLGILAETQENWPQATKWFSQVVILAPSNSTIAHRAQLHVRRCEYAAKLDALPGGKVRRKYSESISRARWFVRAGLAREAIAEAKQAKKLYPSGWEVYVVVAEAVSSQHKYQLATSLLKTALTIAPPEKKQSLQNAIRTTDSEAHAQGAADSIVARANALTKSSKYLAAAHLYQVAWLVQPDSAYELAAAEALLAGGKSREGQLLLRDVVRRYSGDTAKKARDLLAKMHTASSS